MVHRALTFSFASVTVSLLKLTSNEAYMYVNTSRFEASFKIMTCPHISFNALQKNIYIWTDKLMEASDRRCSSDMYSAILPSQLFY